MINDMTKWPARVDAEEPATAASKANSCFTDLPAEVQNRIYEFAPIGEDKIEVQTLGQFEAEDRFVVVADPVPALLHLNRQVRQEAIPVYYGNNNSTATFDRTWAAVCEDKTKPSKTVSGWAATIGPQQVSMLSKLEIRYPETCLTDLGWQLPYDSDELLPFNKQRDAVYIYGARELLCKSDIMQALELHTVGVNSAVVRVIYDNEEFENGVELEEWMRRKWQQASCTMFPEEHQLLRNSYMALDKSNPPRRDS